MKHYGPLYKGEVSPLIERSLVAQVVDMMCLQFNPLASRKRQIFKLRLNAKFNKVSDS